ncbi:hypothetical protein [Fimbriiglobus ruber]|uniref:Transmembrane protein n=1 Tax=Fimbriiglobus ruber TaxID=1908690 RepID=A0A225D904_9BACT|nr:hypothetical protein [Fimbriiglobus ruber]OWK38041.1 hypothetical protein FRUB_07161 [Fimbriiglobus ruber]
MNEKDIGTALLRVDAGDARDPRVHTRLVLDRDRRRVRLLMGLTVLVWLTAGALVLAGLVNFGLTFPRQAKLVHDVETGELTPAQRDEAQRLVLVSFQKGTLLIAFSVAVMAVGALATVVLIFASRRATVRQLNAGLVEIARQLEELRRSAASSGPPSPSAT